MKAYRERVLYDAVTSATASWAITFRDTVALIAILLQF